MLKLSLFVTARYKGYFGASSHALLAWSLLSACSGTRDGRTAARLDPCERMQVEAARAEELEDDVRALGRTAYGEARSDAVADTAAKVTAESLLVRKESLLAMTLRSMQENAEACAARSRGFEEEDP